MIEASPPQAAGHVLVLLVHQFGSGLWIGRTSTSSPEACCKRFDGSIMKYMKKNWWDTQW